MNNMIELSIIVPVYNVSNYVKECIESLLDIQNNKIEIIVVDDGSTDDSLTIIESFCDNRIKVIKKHNTGYGDSMNSGIRAAKGEYIAFLESDDKAVPESYEKVLRYAIQMKADVVKGNYNLWEGNTYKYFENHNGFDYGMEIKDKTRLFFTAPAIWSGIYNRKFLLENDVWFLPTPGASYQDTSFAFKVWVNANKIYLLDLPMINYRIDSTNSSSNSTSKVFSIREEYREVDRYLKSKNINNFWPIFFKCKHISYMWNIGRLSPENKMKFLVVVQHEYREAFDKQYLIRGYWSDYDWEIIHLIIFNIKLAWRELYVGDLMAQRQNDILDCLKMQDKVYILNNDYYRDAVIHRFNEYGINSITVLNKLDDNMNDIVVSTDISNNKYNNVVLINP